MKFLDSCKCSILPFCICKEKFEKLSITKLLKLEFHPIELSDLRLDTEAKNATRRLNLVWVSSALK